MIDITEILSAWAKEQGAGNAIHNISLRMPDGSVKNYPFYSFHESLGGGMGMVEKGFEMEEFNLNEMDTVYQNKATMEKLTS